MCMRLVIPNAGLRRDATSLNDSVHKYQPLVQHVGEIVGPFITGKRRNNGLFLRLYIRRGLDLVIMKCTTEVCTVHFDYANRPAALALTLGVEALL